MSQSLAIAAGGALGALMRFWASNAVYQWLGRGFPWGTLFVNVAGSLMMGFLFVVMTERLAIAAEWRGFVLVGFLGAFTTYSTFSIETVNLLEQAEYLRAFANMAVSVTACVVAALIGVMLARQLA